MTHQLYYAYEIHRIYTQKTFYTSYEHVVISAVFPSIDAHRNYPRCRIST